MRTLLKPLLLAATPLMMADALAFSPYPQAPWYVPAAAAAYPAYYRPAPRLPSLAFARPNHGYGIPRSVPPAATDDVPSPATAAPKAPAAASKTPPSTAKVDIKAANQAFLDRLTPMIEKENRRLRTLQRSVRAQIAEGVDDSQQRTRLEVLARRYRVDGDVLTDPAAQHELLHKIDQIPVSLALAQAANESAWGRSRFAREGNNLFGIWTYDESKGIVPRNRAPGKKHLVRTFDSEADSVRYYMFTLNSHPAYAELRRIRAQLRARGESLDSLALAEGLLAYSAKGEEYVQSIRGMIRRFELAAYDGRPPSEA